MNEPYKLIAQKDITDLEIFSMITELNFDGITTDLHNEFTCTKIDFGYNSEHLSLYYAHDKATYQVYLAFQNPVIQKCLFMFEEGNNIPDSIIRNRIEEDNAIVDVSKNGQQCYFIYFINGNVIELLCTRVIATLYKCI